MLADVIRSPTVVALSLLALWSVAGGRVRAQENAPLRSPVAQAHFDRAMEHYRGDALVEARRELDAAYAVELAPILLYARAQVSRLLGDCAAALALYRAFLATDPPAAEAEDARANVARCARAERSTAAPPPAATSAPRVAEPAAETSVESRAAGDGPRWFEDPFAGAMLGASAAAIVVGASFAIVSAVEEADAAAASIHDEYAEQIEAAARDRAIGWVLLAIGGAALIAAIVRYATVGDRARSDRALVRF